MSKEKTFFIRQFINGKLFTYKKVVATEEDFKALEQFLLKSQDGLERIDYIDFEIIGYNKKTKRLDKDFFRIVVKDYEEAEIKLKKELKGRTINNIKISKVKYIAATLGEPAPKQREKGNILERKTEKLLIKKGYKVITRYEKTFDDEGIDIIAEKDKKVLLIQCKNWDNRLITQKTLREFLGACEFYIEEHKEELKGKEIKKYLVVNKNTPLSNFAEKTIKKTKLLKLVRIETDERENRNTDNNV